MSGTITKSGDTPINCSLIKGQFEPLGMQTRSWRVAGFDGKSHQQTGKDSKPRQITVFLFDTQANYIAWRDAIYAVSGEVVTIVNSDNLNSGNVLLKSVSDPVIKSGFPNYAVKASIQLTVETC